MASVTRVAVIYDAECGLCTRTKNWMLGQTPQVGLEFVAVGSAEARQRFPQLPQGELAVVANTGEVWFGNRAWIVCLWALQDYRALALRLTSPLLLTLAREAFAIVSKNRFALSNLLRLRNEREIEIQLRKVSVPQCQNEPQTGQK